jgi:hypothetical protein
MRAHVLKFLILILIISTMKLYLKIVLRAVIFVSRSTTKNMDTSRQVVAYNQFLMINTE